MKLLIVHLSDLHIEVGDSCVHKMGKVGEALTEHLVDADMCIVVLSGDIAYSGKKEEYDCALEALAKLDEQLRTRGHAKTDFIIVPGNHDCDFTIVSSLRQFTIDSLKNASAAKLIDKKCIDECTTTQQNFFSFAECLCEGAPRFEYLDRICYGKEIAVGRYSVRFNCYNTAWISQIQEKPSDLMFPVDLIQPSNQNYDVVFSVLHHPYGWLRIDNGKEFKKLLEKTSDIIITGHEHDLDFSSVRRIHGEITDYVEGGLFQGKGTRESSFNVIIIDLDARTKKIVQYAWDTDLYSVATSLDWTPFLRSRALSLKWDISEPYLKYLDDVEATLTHPRRGLLKLSDIYIPPALKEQKMAEKGNNIRYSIVESHRTLEYIKDTPELVVIGSERSGKTALAKVLFKLFHEQAEIPLLLNGSDLKGLDEGKWTQLLEKEVIHQYSNDLLERYRQLEKEKKCILVDDFDKSQFNIDGKIKALAYLRKRYGRIVLLTDALFRFEEITRQKRDDNPLAQFKHCDIAEFGYLLKEKMIEKWVVMGREHTIAPEEIAGQVRNMEHIVNTVLGKNLLPSYPFFILSILQTVEAQTPHTTVSGTYGYFYEHFILEALALTSREHDLDTKYTFLSEIAFYAFVNDRFDLTEDDLTRITGDYFHEYKMRINIKGLVADFCRVLLLQESNGSWSFKYRYEYYYFVARYMANKLRDKKKGAEIQKYAAEMTKAVYKEDYYNIVIFLSYLSHDPIIMDHMLENAALIYENYEAYDFDKHASFLNDLVPDTPKIVYEPKDPKQEKERRLKKKDETAVVEDEVSDKENQTEDVLKINIAFKTMDILGQIVRNYAGSLSADVKIDLIRSTYLIGLRTLNALVQFLEEQLPGFREMLTDRIKDKKRIRDEEELKKQVDRRIFWIAEVIAFAIIKKISYSVGSEKLREIYREILDGSQGELHSKSIALIDCSIKLDHYTSIPYTDIINLHQKILGNVFSTTLLRLMTVEHLYLFPTDYKVRQSICKQLAIAVNDPKMIDPGLKKLKK